MKDNLISLDERNSKALNYLQSKHSNKNAEITHRKILEEKIMLMMEIHYQISKLF